MKILNTIDNKRRYVHQGEQPFWEGFEELLIDTFDYNPSFAD